MSLSYCNESHATDVGINTKIFIVYCSKIKVIDAIKMADIYCTDQVFISSI